MSIWPQPLIGKQLCERERPLCSTVSTNTSDSLYLLVRNVSADDSGAFECVANNGVGDEAKNTSFLLVRGTYATYVYSESLL